jgi:hypothetical protein
LPELYRHSTNDKRQSIITKSGTLKKAYHNVSSRPLLNKLNGGDAHTEYGEDGLDGIEENFSVHGCQMEYGTIGR